MTIQEAIWSGSPFRRKDDSSWISSLLAQPRGIETMLSHLSYMGSDQKVRLSVKDILADDWEIKQ